MTYISPRLAPLILPSQAFERQTVAGGGVLMVATRERFDVANPGHMAAASAIDTALVPLNALPWPADTRQYNIQSCWGPRGETSEAVANRYTRMVDALAQIDPVFTPWWYWGCDANGIPFDQARAKLPALIADDVKNLTRPADRYWVGGGNALGFTPPCIIFSGLIADHPAGTGYANGVGLEAIAPRVVPTDASIVTYNLFRAAMLAIIKAWDVTWCAAHPTDLEQYWPVPRDNFFRLAWMSYVSPRFAPLIRPSQAIETQTVAGGRLLLVATRERFDVANPEHLAGARAIDSAMDPLNALPWPPP